MIAIIIMGKSSIGVCMIIIIPFINLIVIITQSSRRFGQ